MTNQVVAERPDTVKITAFQRNPESTSEAKTGGPKKAHTVPPTAISAVSTPR